MLNMNYAELSEISSASPIFAMQRMLCPQGNCLTLGQQCDLKQDESDARSVGSIYVSYVGKVYLEKALGIFVFLVEGYDSISCKTVRAMLLLKLP